MKFNKYPLPCIALLFIFTLSASIAQNKKQIEIGEIEFKDISLTGHEKEALKQEFKQLINDMSSNKNFVIAKIGNTNEQNIKLNAIAFSALEHEGKELPALAYFIEMKMEKGGDSVKTLIFFKSLNVLKNSFSARDEFSLLGISSLLNSGLAL